MVDKPEDMFGPRRREIFIYVFDNPGCTRDEIELAIYGKLLATNNKVVTVHLSRIKTMLDRWTNFQLVSYPSNIRPPHAGKARFAYKITFKPSVRIEKTTVANQTAGPNNVTS
jgi:hypothetical protein